MVLRASRGGSIASFTVKPGDQVSPASVLLTLEVPAPPDLVAIATAARVAVAQRRVAALQASAQQPGPAGAAGRVRFNDLRHQREMAEAELASAEEALTRLAPLEPAEMPIVAGVHGVVLSLETAVGAQAAAGSALIRLADCDHGYVTLNGPAALNPGSSVEVRLPDQAPVPATVRPATRIAGPSNGMVAEPAPGAFGQHCRMGVTGLASPMPAAS